MSKVSSSIIITVTAIGVSLYFVYQSEKVLTKAMSWVKQTFEFLTSCQEMNKEDNQDADNNEQKKLHGEMKELNQNDQILENKIITKEDASTSTKQGSSLVVSWNHRLLSALFYPMPDIIISESQPEPEPEEKKESVFCPSFAHSYTRFLRNSDSFKRVVKEDEEQLPFGWKAIPMQAYYTRQVYYYNSLNGNTQWIIPRENEVSITSRDAYAVL